MKRMFALGLFGIIVSVVGGLVVLNTRLDRCGAVPLLTTDVLPNSAFLRDEDNNDFPDGWDAPAKGPARLAAEGDFTVTGQGRSMQLIGIGNAVYTPAIDVQAGIDYCFVGQALADQAPIPTRLALRFSWFDTEGTLLIEDTTDWQEVKTPAGGGWSVLQAGFRAPEGAQTLRVGLHPASDDRIYIDEVQVRQQVSLVPGQSRAVESATTPALTVAPWPEGYAAALSFSFDWETTMGGLIHSRSVDDPNNAEDALIRGMRMREGVTTTLQIFEPYDIRATYYANGYNFLLSNTERREFMGNPTFVWADTTQQWKTDEWKTKPWFAPDPYGTVVSHPEWYFGDLVPVLQNADQDIQSHTFSHLYGGLASTEEWQADLEAWREVAAERDVLSARSLAFPWSSSGGMTYANWQLLESEGITAVTRTNRSQRQYQLVTASDPHCRPVPGHERILACPDFYLTTDTVAEAQEQIDQIIAVGGMIDLWAHTEEVVSPEQIAAWDRVVEYAAEQQRAGDVWIAPLIEIAAWQQAREQVAVEAVPSADEASQTFRVTNGSERKLAGLTLQLPFVPQQIKMNDQVVDTTDSTTLMIDIEAGQTVEVTLWPA
ncbi:MAG: polysaccharide deacetylase [Chloroflexi bacterium AL-W]|nr:polysaccharide deacetylase [Chloroflexi bacterium AL-N1]NOK69425.1 polysaccharide deacetylase [Chloroflexi bacterium AL-N10]NOK77390.1 polysaccharide deacetylase [Chloroflexi bacterium AL-N5]NOK84241.1 polysaccharide deacetylase [Chloroflexi bacterium AL-W]NOK91594.1 polysaccharide deacetylase [Chloroflexi bacterium AL-N15]